MPSIPLDYVSSFISHDDMLYTICAIAYTLSKIHKLCCGKMFNVNKNHDVIPTRNSFLFFSDSHDRESKATRDMANHLRNVE